MENGTGRPDGSGLLTRAQVAEMAGVTRAAVTTWERREPDFPVPRRTGGRDYFYASEVLHWFDGRRVPPRRRTPEEDGTTTYGDRARRHGPAATAVRTAPEATAPARWSGRALLAPGPGEAPNPRDVAVVRELMGPLTESVGGAGREVGYLSLLAALHFLRVTEADAWREVTRCADSGDGARSGSALLRLVGLRTDSALRSAGILSGMQDALSHLEPRRFQDLATVVRLVGELGSRAFQLIVNEYEERTRLRSREFFTPLPVAHLMAALGHNARSSAPRSVYDPYFRGGELLGAAADVAAWARNRPGGGEEPPPRLMGQTPKRETLPLASMNLALRGVQCALRLRTAGRPWEEAWTGKPIDLVLTNPPFNMKDTLREITRGGHWPYGPPPVGNDNLAYPQYALSVLAEGGRAAVVMPNKAGNSDNAAETAIRTAFVERGVVECVVALPDKLFSGTSVPVCVWLLRHPADAGDHVLFLDARDLGGMGRGGRRVLALDDIVAVLDAYLTLRRGGAARSDDEVPEAPEIVPGVRVDRRTLRERGCSLNPIDHIAGRSAPDAGGAGTAAADPWAEVEELLERSRELDERTAGLRAASAAAPSGRESLREVALEDLCDIQTGASHALLAPKDRTPHGTVPVVFPRHLRDGRVCDPGEERVSEELARRLARYRLRPDDIVCVRAGTMGAPSLVRWDQEGWLMSSNLIRLRCREDADVLPAYLLLVLSRASAVDWVKDRAAATAAPFITKAALGRQKVLLPPLSAQQETAERLALLEERSLAHRELAEEITQVRGRLLERLTGTPVPHDPRLTNRSDRAGDSERNLLQ
ncbi:N-6 DNA methylase [Streptomyces sp. NPDC096068]|uniref:N-6 DNA methylase n=1 Tax=Streptomyces sp. NPDC096068 TaxID=3155424 RepID=UPI00331E4FF5